MAAHRTAPSKIGWPAALTAVSLLVCSCGASTPPTGETPAISAISWKTTSTILISGNSFGAKSPAAPAYWADVETDKNPSPLSVNKTWPLLNADRVQVTRNGKSTYVLRGDISISEDAVGPGIKGFDSETWYVSVKRFYDFDITTSLGSKGLNLKVNRFWPDVITGATPWGNDCFIGWQGNEGLNSGRATDENTSVDGGFYFYDHGPFLPQTWLNEQIIHRIGDIDVQNGVFSYIRNGVNLMYDWQDNQYRKNQPGLRLWRLRTKDRPHIHSQFYFDQVSNGTGVGPLYVYYDNIYIDNTWARVMLCDTATWSACKQPEVQIPVSWSDSMIEAVVNYGDLDATSPIYAYVVNQEGAANENGMLMQ